VAQGDHTIVAVLKDDTGVELARDTNENVGIRGNYYITVGNSITNGIDDNFAADNISDDERIVASQGYQANLNNLLSSTLARPHIIYNEGIGGDTAQDAANERIDSILDRHPAANNALVLLGTNDSGTSTEYRSAMQSLINSMNNAGLTPWVALIPPAFNPTTKTLNATKNAVIQGYNDEIPSLAGSKMIGPDFFTFFEDKASLISDDVHPNAYGFVIMAYLWHNTITGTSLALPLILENLTPQEYQQNLLEIGDAYYIDQSHTLTDIPAELDGGIWIVSENADYTNTSSAFISFQVDRNVEVYVAYDSGVSTPSWLNGFVNANLQITTTDIRQMDLYKADFSESDNPIELGGNRADGGAGAFNYLVIVKER
jgi:lysophospholipase L1-like esterase